MTMVRRSVAEPIRQRLDWGTRWESDDRGLIAAWERGREKARESPELAAAVSSGVLPTLPWKGSGERKTKQGWRYGSLLYLAMWQGLRGEDLQVSLADDHQIVCSSTGMRVVFTSDEARLAEEEDPT